MAGYTSVPFPQQLTIMKDTMPLSRLATDAVTMWQKVKGELTNSSTSLRQGLKHLENAWRDQAGENCQARGLKSCADIDSWPPKIDEVVSGLTELGALIDDTARKFGELEQRYLAAFGPGLRTILPQLQQEGGALLDILAGKFQAATGTLASAKGKPWSGPSGSSGGGAGGGTTGSGGTVGGSSGAGQAASASAGGAAGPSAASAASASGAGAGAGAGAGIGAIDEEPDLAGNPSLQGLESSGMSPQATLPPPAPPATAPTAHTVSPVMPPLGSSGVGAGGIPGVRLGGGPRSIPQAAMPISTDAPNTAQKPPAAPSGATPSSGAARGGTAMGRVIPPMSPMMGGAGAGGSGGGPGPGTAQPTASRRGPRSTSTPGLPASLRGKADGAGRSGFAPLSRPARREPEEDITTVQLLDEEMWQTDQAPEIRGERPKSARPTDR